MRISDIWVILHNMIVFMNKIDEIQEDLSGETNLDVVGELNLENNEKSDTEGVHN